MLLNISDFKFMFNIQKHRKTFYICHQLERVNVSSCNTNSIDKPYLILGNHGHTICGHDISFTYLICVMRVLVESMYKLVKFIHLYKHFKAMIQKRIMQDSNLITNYMLKFIAKSVISCVTPLRALCDIYFQYIGPKLISFGLLK